MSHNGWKFELWSQMFWNYIICPLSDYFLHLQSEYNDMTWPIKESWDLAEFMYIVAFGGNMLRSQPSEVLSLTLIESND